MRRFALVALVSVFTLIAAACGGDDGGSAGDGGGGAAISPTAGGSGTSIAVTVGETDPENMYLTLSSNSAPAGAVTFSITNEGQKVHEFVVLKTDTMAADLPYDEAADEVVEKEDEVVDEIEDMDAGSTYTLTVDLEPGHYAIICNLEGHWRMGMRIDFEVT